MTLTVTDVVAAGCHGVLAVVFKVRWHGVLAVVLTLAASGLLAYAARSARSDRIPRAPAIPLPRSGDSAGMPDNTLNSTVM